MQVQSTSKSQISGFKFKEKPWQTASGQGSLLTVLTQAFPFFLCIVYTGLKITCLKHNKSCRNHLLLHYTWRGFTTTLGMTLSLPAFSFSVNTWQQIQERWFDQLYRDKNESSQRSRSFMRQLRFVGKACFVKEIIRRWNMLSHKAIKSGIGCSCLTIQRAPG